MSLWTAKIHCANVETGTSPYNEVALSTVTALSGYYTVELGVTAVHETPLGEPGIMYANGGLQQSRIARRSYELASYPYEFDTQRSTVTTEVYKLMQFAYLWVELNVSAQDPASNVGNTAPYHTTDYVIPVTLDGFSIEHNDDLGTKIIKLSLKHRFYNQ